MKNQMGSTLRDYNSPQKRNFGVDIILPDRYFHISLPIVPKHVKLIAHCLPQQPPSTTGSG